MNTDIPAADTQPSAPPPDTRMPPDTADAIRRYMRLQLDIFLLEQEKERLRDTIVRELGANVPGIWHPVLDGKPLTVMHSYRTTVRYNEQTPTNRRSANGWEASIAKSWNRTATRFAGTAISSGLFCRRFWKRSAP